MLQNGTEYSIQHAAGLRRRDTHFADANTVWGFVSDRWLAYLQHNRPNGTARARRVHFEIAHAQISAAQLLVARTCRADTMHHYADIMVVKLAAPPLCAASSPEAAQC